MQLALATADFGPLPGDYPYADSTAARAPAPLGEVIGQMDSIVFENTF